MKLVVDANVLFSFFKKDSTTRELILDPELKFFKGEGHEIGLWSNEKRLKKVKKYGIKKFTTSELITFLSEARP